ncbi:cbb3-type cytochrome oxidase assembly protein CcoS [Methylobacillus arboreus]|uniref:cbb3-type cytochrome oxidase assembly protein CcoS n=1 Tax=Methylobacillus arboreus TaxID=755170 RepID=UPI001E625FDA|nr:cbb3-type cytochrome oxidase assembly protein CcoS [Methylobacillus arboreus]MCB5191474.1 cbb3-type cytochrome oxidase assembly protein CcoS [Methylobacillus arboreus]
MLANSFVIILLSLAVGIPPLIFLFMALTSGQFDHVDAMADSIFEADEMRYFRPWENRKQAQQRLEQHGGLLNNPNREWERWL